MKTKKFENLTIADPFLFDKVMREPENCKPLLEALLEEEITKITRIPDTQLDIYKITEKTGGVYDLSLQIAEMKVLPLFVRAIQVIMDSIAREAGCPEDNLPDICIIMVCPDDPVGLGRAVYRIGKKISPSGVKCEDGTRVLFLNRAFTVGNAPKTVLDFLRWINAGQAGEEFDVSGSAYLTQLEEAVRKIKNDPFMERAYRDK